MSIPMLARKSAANKLRMASTFKKKVRESSATIMKRPHPIIEDAKMR